jgi:hypothetical protein
MICYVPPGENGATPQKVAEIREHYPSDNCSGCIHYDPASILFGPPRCKAFPESIPIAVWNDEVPHTNPMPEQQGTYTRTDMTGTELEEAYARLLEFA